MTDRVSGPGRDLTYLLGVDGGGTGCRARVEDSAGTVLGQGAAGPATTRLGIDRAWSAITAACDAAIAAAGLGTREIARIHVGIGLAGVGRKGALEALGSLEHGFASLQFISDGRAACLGAHSGRDGGIVIVGTGSIGIGQVAGRDLRVGGYGFPMSDEGSGADIGLRAMRLALQAYDGRFERTPLLTEVMELFRDDWSEAAAWMERATATDYATLAPTVIRHAAQGDVAGRLIVHGAAKDVDALVRALFDMGAPCVSLLGGLSRAIEPWLQPDVRESLKPADGDAVSGAVILARRFAEGLGSKAIVP